MPPKKVPYFKPGKELKDLINRSTEPPADTPPPVRRLVARCLDKNPRTRLQDMGEARIALADDGDGRCVDLEVNRPTDRQDYFRARISGGCHRIGVVVAQQ